MNRHGNDERGWSARTVRLWGACSTRAVRNVLVALHGLCLFFAAVPWPAAADQENNPPAALQAEVDTQVVRVPVIDGNDIHAYLHEARAFSDTSPERCQRRSGLHVVRHPIWSEPV